MKIKEIPYEEKLELCEDYGWVEYYGKTVIKSEWITLRKPYDRMAVPID